MANAKTADVKVPSGLPNVRSLFSCQEVLEITTSVASYNMVSRLLVALYVSEQNEKSPAWAPKVADP